MRVYTRGKKISIIIFFIIMALPWLFLILYIASNITGAPLTHFGTAIIASSCIIACIVSAPISSILIRYISVFQPNNVDIVVGSDTIRIGNDVLNIQEIQSCEMTYDQSPFSEYDIAKSKQSLLIIKCKKKNYYYTCEYTPKYPIYINLSSMEDVYRLMQINLQLAEWFYEHDFTETLMVPGIISYYKEKKVLETSKKNRKKIGICIIAIPIVIFAFFIFMLIRGIFVALT